MNKKKIIILGKLPPPYIGPSIATQIIINSSLKNEFELIHINTGINKTISSFGKFNIGKIFKNIGIYARLKAVLIAHRPHLVVIPISQTTAGFIKDSLYILIAAFFRKKILLQLRGSNFKTWVNKGGRFVKWYVRFTLKKTKGIIVLGNNLKYLFLDYFPENKIFVVPNGGNYIFPSKKSDGKINVLFLSNLLVDKGVTDVIKAIELISRELNSNLFHIDLVGDWYKQEDKKACDEIISGKNLPITIHSPKSGNEKLQLLANADIFVFPPREPEGHPWSIIEAMAAGLPVISTDKGAIIESVINNKNGFIVEPAKAEQIAEKLKLLIENQELRVKMGAESRNLYLENFTEEKMTENLSKVFKKVMEL